jgi:hypothetical protein
VLQRTAIVTALITERPLCMACISSRASLAIAEVQEVFRVIQQVLPIRDAVHGRCRACGTVGPVFSVEQPPPQRPTF